MQRATAVLAGALLLAGCSASTIHEIRKPNRLYKSYELNASLDDIDAAFYKWASICEPLAGLTRDPRSPTKAMLVATDTHGIVALMDFTESSPGRTKVDSYVCAGCSRGGQIDGTIRLIETANEPDRRILHSSRPSRCHLLPIQYRFPGSGGSTMILPVVVQ